MQRRRAALVEFRGVSKTYDGETLVVRALDLSVEKGEFLTLLGPSGSGKTTTLMMLAGFEAPTGGEILLEGRSIARLPPYRRDIGMVFQNYALFPHMTVAENIAFPLSVRRVSRSETAERVERALATVRLAGFGGRRPAQLSGGQQQRVALARALVFEPKLVLMDEPLGALDRQLREHMQLEIRGLHEELGITVVYVTHDQTEALTMSDRIAVFDHGRVLQLDEPAGLYERPATAFVARFIGENNRLPAVLQGVQGGAAVARLPCGTELRGLARDCGAAGSAVTLSIRPERIALGPGAEGGNRLSGRLAETIYAGDHVRLRLVLADGAELMVKRPGGDLTPLPAPGEPTVVSFRAEDCLVFAPETGAPAPTAEAA